MNDTIITFLNANHIGVLTTILPDGMPHAATMHYASNTKGDTFVFFTKEKSRKCSHFEVNQEYKAALVIGFSEEEWTEVQMEGTLKKLARESSEEALQIFTSKYEKAMLDEEHVVLVFTPTWWRYSKMRPKPGVIISSEDQ